MAFSQTKFNPQAKNQSTRSILSYFSCFREKRPPKPITHQTTEFLHPVDPEKNEEKNSGENSLKKLLQQKYLLESFKPPAENTLADNTREKTYPCEWNTKLVTMKKILITNNTIEDCIRERNIMTILAETKVATIPLFYGYSTSPQHYYLLSEFIPNNLSNYILNNPQPVSWDLRYKILINITEALATIHKNNIIHGDINSDNVFLTNSLQAKLGNFHFATTTNAPGLLYGTPLYMAPELHQNEPNSKESDMYSLAMVYFVIASWELPYKSLGNIADELLLEQITNGYRCSLPDKTPAKIGKLIELGWSANKHLRLSAQECLDELKNTDIDTLSEKLAGLKL